MPGFSWRNKQQSDWDLECGIKSCLTMKVRSDSGRNDFSCGHHNLRFISGIWPLACIFVGWPWPILRCYQQWQLFWRAVGSYLGAGTGSQNSTPISFNTGINHEISVIVTASLQWITGANNGAWLVQYLLEMTQFCTYLNWRRSVPTWTDVLCIMWNGT